MISSLQKMIIDTDAGVDDAIALMMALSHTNTDVKAITAVNGNVGVDKVTANIALILDHFDRDVPFFTGCDRPLSASIQHSDGIHGADGLGGATAKYPRSIRDVENEHGVLSLIRLANENSGNLTLLALGPLTNIALAVHLDPEFVNNISKLVIMGGAIEARGNASTVAEFNIFADPEAAAVVFNAGFQNQWLLSWETTLKYPLPWDEFDEFGSNSTRRSRLFGRMTEQLASFLKNELDIGGFLLPDPLAAAVALESDIVKTALQVPVAVELDGNIGRGLTGVDWNYQSGKDPNTNVIIELDSDRTFNLIRGAVNEDRSR